MRKPAAVRFTDRVTVLDGGCHLWTGATDPNGYGRFFFAGRMDYAHRVAYRWTRGSIPAGYDVDHLCRNRWCVNPDHLEAVTRRENLHRGKTLTAAHAAGVDCGFDNCRVCRRFQVERLLDQARRVRRMERERAESRGGIR